MWTNVFGLLLAFWVLYFAFLFAIAGIVYCFFWCKHHIREYRIRNSEFEVISLHHLNE